MNADIYYVDQAMEAPKGYGWRLFQNGGFALEGK
jgi:hypothetical protein